jgi:hypothetical protein
MIEVGVLAIYEWVVRADLVRAAIVVNMRLLLSRFANRKQNLNTTLITAFKIHSYVKWSSGSINSFISYHL